jgi:hypothetical protein
LPEVTALPAAVAFRSQVVRLLLAPISTQRIGPQSQASS